MIEGPYAEEWIYGLLARDPYIMSSVVQGRVFRNLVAQDMNDQSGSLLPAIRYFEVASNDLVVTGAYRVISAIYYQIEVVDKKDTIRHLVPVADRMDTILHKANGYVSGAHILSCTRNTQMVRSSVDQELQYQQVGGLYRINIQAWKGTMARVGAYASGV